MATWDITTANTPLEFDTTNNSKSSLCMVDSNHVLCNWAGEGNDGYIQVFTINTSTWAITTANTWLEHDTRTCYSSSHNLLKIDTTHFILIYLGGLSDINAQIFTVNTSTWAVTTSSARFSIIDYSGSSQGIYFGLIQVSTNKFVVLAGSADNSYYSAITIQVNTSTWAVSTANDIFNFFTSSLTYKTINGALIDSNHILAVFTESDNDGFAQVLEVNTSTWAITTSANYLEYDTQNGIFPNVKKIDDSHLLILAKGGASQRGRAYIITVNTSNWSLSLTSSFEYTTVYGTPAGICMIDANHFVIFYFGVDSDGFTQVFTINTSTWAITTSSASLEYDTVYANYPDAIQIDTTHYICSWTDNDGDGKIQTFTIEVPFLDNIKKILGVAWSIVTKVSGVLEANIKKISKISSIE